MVSRVQCHGRDRHVESWEGSTGLSNMEPTLRRAVLSERRGEARVKRAELGLLLKGGDRGQRRLECEGSRGFRLNGRPVTVFRSERTGSGGMHSRETGPWGARAVREASTTSLQPSCGSCSYSQLPANTGVCQSVLMPLPLALREHARLCCAGTARKAGSARPEAAVSARGRSGYKAPHLSVLK